ncbi:hypothetical protein RHS03_08610, partial [Rhizoctonia solani]
MKSRSSSSQNGMRLTGRSQSSTSPYSRLSGSDTVSKIYCDDQFDQEQDCATKCPPPRTRNLTDAFFQGSAPLFSDAFLQSPLDIGSFSTSDLVSVDGYQDSDPLNEDSNWCSPLPPTTMSVPTLHSSSQVSFSASPSIESGNMTSNRSRQAVAKRCQGPSSRRPTPEDFRSMVLCPHEHEAQIHDYVGTDSKYTLAKNYAGMMVRSSVKSHDMRAKMHEVSQALDSINLFLRFLLDYEGLRSEQKGCVSLRICFGALTALLGDFSQGNCVELSASDPNAPVVSREYLPQFRDYSPELGEILRRLSERLEKSINLYRHRRSPSCSLVTKFQEMWETLEVWNKYLMDDTFAIPSRIASDWLRNHPNQVDNRRRNQAYNEQTSPNLSDNSRPSPTNYDLNYLSPISAYAEAIHSPRGNGRSARTDGSFSYEPESLFKASTSATADGVTYFSSANMSSGSMPFDASGNIYRTPSALGQTLNFTPITGDFMAYAHQSHSHNARQYPGTGSGY